MYVWNELDTPILYCPISNILNSNLLLISDITRVLGSNLSTTTPARARGLVLDLGEGDDVW